MKQRGFFRGSPVLLAILALSTATSADVLVGDRSVPCAEDNACINRLHPDIPMVARANPG